MPQNTLPLTPNTHWTTYLTQPNFLRVYALAWSALVTIILLQSSSQPVVGPPAPPGKPDLGREILLTAGHIIAFSILVLVWWNALRIGSPHLRALLLAVMIALIMGTVTEMLQTLIADRNASLHDLLSNWGSALLMAWIIQRRYSPNRSSHSSISSLDK